MLLCGSATDYISSRICLIALVNIRVFPFLLFCTISSASTPISTIYRSRMVNSNTVNSKFHLIRSYCEIFFYHFPEISCLKYTVNLNFHLIISKTLLTNDFELIVPHLYPHHEVTLHTLEIPHMPLFNNCRCSTTEI